MIRSKQPGLRYRRTKNPQFDVTFGTEPVEVPEETARILLEDRPEDFIVEAGETVSDEWYDKLLSVPGVGPSGARDITLAYLDEASFKTAVERNESIVRPSIQEKIIQHLYGEDKQ